MAHVVLRADGGPEIGYGHLVRMNVLARRLVASGHRVTTATATPEATSEIGSDTGEVTTLEARTDVDEFLNRIPDGTDGVVLDSYAADEEYQRAVRKTVPLTLVSDDADRPICADLVVNGNLYANSLEYETLGADPRWRLGPRYALLRESITRLAEREPPWREDPERAIVTMGGSDKASLTPTVLRAFDGFDGSVDAIVGPGFSEQQEAEIRDAGDAISASVTVSRDPDDLPERMFDADFAVSTASTTTYELLALGTPIVSCAVVDNQQPIASALDERDLATVVGQENGARGFESAIDAYLTDPDLRRRRSERGRELVDGKGARRVTDAILGLVGSDGAEELERGDSVHR